MRQLLIILLALPLAACGGGGGSSQPSQSIAPAAPSEPIAALPASPAFSYSSLSGKTYSNGEGSLSFTGSRVIDTRCGYNYAVQSTSQAGDVLTVTTKLIDQSDFTAPLTTDCEIHPDFTSYRTNAPACVQSAMEPTTRLIGFYATYTIQSVNGGLAVSRLLETYRYRALCDSGATAYHSTFKGIAEEMLNE